MINITTVGQFCLGIVYDTSQKTFRRSADINFSRTTFVDGCDSCDLSAKNGRPTQIQMPAVVVIVIDSTVLLQSELT